MKKTKILMCGSHLSVKGGMVSVVKNYLKCKQWGEYEIIYIPTHIEKNKIAVLLYFIIAYIKILFIVIFGKISIAHLHTSERGSFFRKAILAKTLKKFGIKIILHHHGAEFESFYANLSNRNKKFVNKTLESVDLNIVLSQRLIPTIKNKAPHAKVSVLYNAVPTLKNNPYTIRSHNCLFLGRLGQRKGIYDLLEAIQQIDTELPSDIKFYLCGDGEIDRVKEKITYLKITHRIAYVGWLDDFQKKQVFKSTAVSILPSYNEGLPMSILEAMSFGIPVISTNIASIPEVVFSGINGYLIQPGDIKSLGNNIIQLMENDSKRYAMSNKAFAFISNSFSLNRHISDLKKIYQRLQLK